MKLIRDRIPGINPEDTRIAPFAEREALLREKLREEAGEVADAMSRVELLSEMGDLYEVMCELACHRSISFGEIITAAREKREERGGFKNGVVLIRPQVKQPKVPS
jgi:predicted house-cleaning noncanonical NTP pyrophosphatase (MazG superfamily)